MWPAVTVRMQVKGMVRIRLARESDADAIAAIYAPIVGDTAISFETAPPPPDDMARRIVETRSRYPWLVCDVGGVIAGYAYATAHRTRAAYRWSVDTSAYTHPAHHRRGIGRALYVSLFEILRAQGFVNAYAGITLPNEASVGLHEAVGFSRIGVYRRVGYKLGKWHDVGRWHLGLQTPPERPAELRPLPVVLEDPGWDDLVRTGEALIRASAP